MKEDDQMEETTETTKHDTIPCPPPDLESSPFSGFPGLVLQPTTPPSEPPAVS